MSSVQSRGNSRNRPALRTCPQGHLHLLLRFPLTLLQLPPTPEYLQPATTLNTSAFAGKVPTTKILKNAFDFLRRGLKNPATTETPRSPVPRKTAPSLSQPKPLKARKAETATPVFPISGSLTDGFPPPRRTTAHKPRSVRGSRRPRAPLNRHADAGPWDLTICHYSTCAP